ncbi:MAG: APC family permease [Chlamydiota bacterium]
MHKKISNISLALLIIAAIDSIRNLPSSALFGSSLIFFFILSAILFFFPTALVAAELTAAFPKESGIYHWIRLAFGEKIGMLAIWLQWINTMVWYPTILSFIAGTFAYLINPALVENKTYLALMIVGSFWGLTLISLRGFHFSTKVNSLCAFLGTIIPMALLIILGLLWVFKGEPIQIKFGMHDLLPSLNIDNWISLTAIMASFLGMELAGVHILDVKNPQKNFPRVLMLAAFFILFSMLFGSIAIAIVLPTAQIHLVSGVLQVFSAFFQAFHLAWFLPILVLSIVIGSLGNIISWQTSPARGLLHAAEFGYLPKFFTKQTAQGVPKNIMITQACLVSIVCLLFLLIPSVNGFYWFLTALSTNLYMLMYVLLFLSAIRLRQTRVLDKAFFHIPGRKKGLITVCTLGLLGCFLTLFVGFIPPTEINVGNTTHYTLYMAAMMIFSIASVSGFFIYKKCKTSSTTPP